MQVTLLSLAAPCSSSCQNPSLLTGKLLRHDGAMLRDDAICQLRALLPEVQERFGVQSLRLFGSTARNQAKSDSDLDLIVCFDGPTTPERLFGLQFFLEDQLHVAIDLVTDKALRPAFRPYIERDALAV